jgi:predicted CopG family antitoxin
MRRLNITIDEELYRKVKALAFFRNESVSEIIRKSLQAWIDRRMTPKEELFLSAKDEKEILDILESDEFIPADEAKQALKI